MAGEVRQLIVQVEKTRGEIAMHKMKLAHAEDVERKLLEEILDACVGDEANEGKIDGTEMAMELGGDVAIVRWRDDYYEYDRERRYKAIDVTFVPCAPQGL